MGTVNEIVSMIARYMGIATLSVAALALVLMIVRVYNWAYSSLSGNDLTVKQLDIADKSTALAVTACVMFTVTSIVAMIGM